MYHNYSTILDNTDGSGYKGDECVWLKRILWITSLLTKYATVLQIVNTGKACLRNCCHKRSTITASEAMSRWLAKPIGGVLLDITGVLFESGPDGGVAIEGSVDAVKRQVAC